jgi:hypothetical protein
MDRHDKRSPAKTKQLLEKVMTEAVYTTVATLLAPKALGAPAVRIGLPKITGRSNSIGCPNALMSGSRIRHRGVMGESNEDANFGARRRSAGMERG